MGAALTSDGWTSVSNKPLLNFLTVTPFGAEFIKAIDTSGQTKDAEYLMQTFKDTIATLDNPNQDCFTDFC